MNTMVFGVGKELHHQWTLNPMDFEVHFVIDQDMQVLGDIYVTCNILYQYTLTQEQGKY